MSNNTNASAYVPGEANINKEEITYRRRVGYAGLFLFIAILTCFILFTNLIWWRLLLIFPAYLAAVGFLQACHRFCVAYGISARQNAEPASRQAHTVTNEASLQKDRRRSRLIQLQAIAIAIIATLLSLFIPSNK